MNQLYSYSPQIWPAVFTVLLLIALAIYSWPRRSMPGVLPFMVSILFSLLWVIGSCLEVAADDMATRIFWAKFQGVLQLFGLTAGTCFILEYAWPGRWLNRRNLVLLLVPCFLALGLMLTNDFHHLIWRGFAYDGKIIPLRGSANWVYAVYAYGLSLLNLIVLAWLFNHSPQQRWPVVLLLIGQISARVLYGLEIIQLVRVSIPLDIPAIALEYTMYSIALFGFRIFDPIPLARQAVIAQMPDGVVVCDLEGRVTLLNPAAERILGLPAKRAKGRSIREFLPAYPDRRFRDTEAITIEISQGAGQELRHYILDISLLTDWRDLPVGCLTLLHDVTEQKAVQAQLLEQQRALAIFSEREMLAREMHDGLGQVLGYIKMQTQAARDCLARDQIATAEEHLAQLTAVAQDAHADVREYIMGAKTTATGQPGFLPALQQYLQRFSENYRLRTELVGPDGWSDGILGATVEAQLLRIIQEALTNTRKHAQARSAQVILHRNNDRLQVIVQDDGVGFDPARLENGEGQKYGLGFLRERAALVGGSVEIQSTPGKGTRVMVEVPLNP